MSTRPCRPGRWEANFRRPNSMHAPALCASSHAVGGGVAVLGVWRLSTGSPSVVISFSRAPRRWRSCQPGQHQHQHQRPKIHSKPDYHPAHSGGTESQTNPVFFFCLLPSTGAWLPRASAAADDNTLFRRSLPRIFSACFPRVSKPLAATPISACQCLSFFFNVSMVLYSICQPPILHFSPSAAPVRTDDGDAGIEISQQTSPAQSALACFWHLSLVLPELKRRPKRGS